MRSGILCPRSPQRPSPRRCAPAQLRGVRRQRWPSSTPFRPTITCCYLLRHWLAAGGLDPDRDLRLIVVPPPLVAQRLAEGAIDGFCAGEPWGSHAASLGVGRIALATGDIWPGHPEKLLAFRADAVADHREAAIACTAAVIAAARWLDDPDNLDDAVRILAGRAFPMLARETIAAALEGQAGGVPLAAPLRFRAATLPRRDDAAWWLGQMRRWGHLPDGVPDAVALVPWASDALWHAAARRVAEPVPPATPSPPAFTPELTIMLSLRAPPSVTVRL